MKAVFGIAAVVLSLSAEALSGTNRNIRSTCNHHTLTKQDKEETIMATKKSISIWTLFGTLIIVAWFLGFALTTGVGTAQQTAPTENKGVTFTPLSAVDLGPEISGMQGRQLRLRMITLEPGGVVAVHSHKDRPGAVYVLKGTVMNHIGDVAKEYGAGQSWAEDRNVTHWVENKGTSPAVLIAADIFKQP
jgi:quercetin dioxygenase-like cupin family protein